MSFSRIFLKALLIFLFVSFHKSKGRSNHFFSMCSTFCQVCRINSQCIYGFKIQEKDLKFSFCAIWDSEQMSVKIPYYHLTLWIYWTKEGDMFLWFQFQLLVQHFGHIYWSVVSTRGSWANDFGPLQRKISRPGLRQCFSYFKDLLYLIIMLHG